MKPEETNKKAAKFKNVIVLSKIFKHLFLLSLSNFDKSFQILTRELYDSRAGRSRWNICKITHLIPSLNIGEIFVRYLIEWSLYI